jgi:23S rRNA (cytidine1920-2'-O)/16S rRNA (cytidine1409-2'-O)-methyltransferase
MGPARRPARRERLDRILQSRGLARSRERAQALIMAGGVRVDGRLVSKAGALVPATAEVVLASADHPYVGRGGLKLRGALEELRIDAEGRVALDIGASTGGFTDCLLQRGAARVYALDVGSGQLDWSLRKDARVDVLEGMNARYLKAEDLPGPVDLAVVDVSFISLRLILPVLPPVLQTEADVVVLVKPQFEVGRREVEAGGLVRDPGKHRAVLQSISGAASKAGLRLAGACASPITGAQGNREFFLHLKTAGACLDAEERAALFERLAHVRD